MFASLDTRSKRRYFFQRKVICPPRKVVSVSHSAKHIEAGEAGFAVAVAGAARSHFCATHAILTPAGQGRAVAWWCVWTTHFLLNRAPGPYAASSLLSFPCK